MFLIKLEYFSNSRLKFLNGFLRHATRLHFLKVENLQNLMLWFFSVVCYLKGLYYFVLFLQLYNAKLIFACGL